jgi:hypothetical protein
MSLLTAPNGTILCDHAGVHDDHDSEASYRDHRVAAGPEVEARAGRAEQIYQEPPDYGPSLAGVAQSSVAPVAPPWSLRQVSRYAAICCLSRVRDSSFTSQGLRRDEVDVKVVVVHFYGDAVAASEEVS